MKEVLALARATRSTSGSALRGREGVDFEIIGCTGGIPGGGFLYTNLDTVAVGRGAQLSGPGRAPSSGPRS